MEIIPVDGKPDFYQLQKRILANNPFKIKVAASRYPAAFVSYDSIPKERAHTSLVLAKYDDKYQLHIITHVTLGVSRAKLKQSGIQEGMCPFDVVPYGHEKAVWLKPIVCTIEYMPSEGTGYRQAVFKGFRDDKLLKECQTV